MAPKVPWKALSRRGAFSSRQVAFFAVAGLILIAGVFLRAAHYFGQPAQEENAPATVEAPPPAAAPPPAGNAAESVPKTPPATQEAVTKANKPADQTSDAAQQAKPENKAVENAQQADKTAEPAEPESKYFGVILVSRKPVEVLAGPSATATAMYGFPAGRPFRVIGREGGFAHIQDVRSGASGWIDEAALTAPPPKRAVAAPSRSKSGRASPKPATASKPKPAKKDAQVATDSDEVESVQPRSRPRLFGRGGLFGGLFRGGN